ncbi:uncharacterized protein BX663DRAFT_493065 [Cokeromyces recurvatus]|uniref:uncharacterized protein n=1 Tax=Cokeromyces recurvatus TaxID=90255 RepID=UPI00221EE185|nr:uncharacterized protein BX663DRAFT_493065 [Cokeromyces recurvatus]KAI7908127.1 hypothetical protein BX663DRAFT_493065 [Cokeromyces recurvatus]
MKDQVDYNVNDYISLTKIWQEDPTAYLSRYYSLFYKTSNEPLNRASIYVRQTPSKVCVLGISDVSLMNDVDQVRLYTNHIGNKVKSDTILCDLINKDGQVISHVRAEMEGKLLELNKRFEEKESCQSLLKDGHHMDIGFIAIILPKTEDTKIQLKDFQTEEEYNIEKEKQKA